MKKILILMVVFFSARTTPAVAQSQLPPHPQFYFKLDSTAVQKHRPSIFKRIFSALTTSDSTTRERVNEMMQELPFRFFQRDANLFRFQEKLHDEIEMDRMFYGYPYQPVAIRW